VAIGGSDNILHPHGARPAICTERTGVETRLNAVDGRIGESTMLAHEEVWTAIDTLAERNGLSPSGLARRSGLDPTTFNKSKRFAPDGRPRWPSTESIAKILTATETSVQDFFGASTPRIRNEAAGLSVPLLGEAHAGFDVPGTAAGPAAAPHPARVIHFPDQRHEPLYALTVIGDSMQPLYRDGDILFVSPNATMTPGDRVVVKLRESQLAVKILSERQGARFRFHAVNPDHSDQWFDTGDVSWMAKIVYATQ
jgi:phage repressor protein C with HTH and peptisase S24 domain